MRIKKLLGTIAMFGLVLMTACTKGGDLDDTMISVKQIDMTVAVPIHSSSLEFFDFPEFKHETQSVRRI